MIDGRGIPSGRPDYGVIRETVLKYLKKTSPHYTKLVMLGGDKEFAEYCRRNPSLMPLFSFGVDRMIYEWVSRGDRSKDDTKVRHYNGGGEVRAYSQLSLFQSLP